MVRCRPITLGQSEPTRSDSTAHHRRQSAGLSPVETTVTSGLCEVGEFDRLTIAEMFLCDPGARDGAAGALLLDGGRGAHQAAASPCVVARRRDGREPSRVKLCGRLLIRASAQARTASGL